MSPTDAYLDEFAGEYCNDKSIHFVAFQAALENRRSEIDLYWKRATYFWAFIAASFIAHFAAYNAFKDGKTIFPFAIACLGGFFTFAFFCVNKGSKFWQENWENQVAILGRAIVGPAFSIVLVRPKTDFKSNSPLPITDPAPISVTKVNQWVSSYLLLIWGFLIYFSSPVHSAQCLNPLNNHPFIAIFCLTLLMGTLMRRRSKTDLGTHTPKIVRISTEIYQ